MLIGSSSSSLSAVTHTQLHSRARRKNATAARAHTDTKTRSLHARCLKICHRPCSSAQRGSPLSAGSEFLFSLYRCRLVLSPRVFPSRRSRGHCWRGKRRSADELAGACMRASRAFILACACKPGVCVPARVCLLARARVCLRTCVCVSSVHALFGRACLSMRVQVRERVCVCIGRLWLWRGRTTTLFTKEARSNVFFSDDPPPLKRQATNASG